MPDPLETVRGHSRQQVWEISSTLELEANLVNKMNPRPARATLKTESNNQKAEQTNIQKQKPRKGQLKIEGIQCCWFTEKNNLCSSVFLGWQ